MTENQEKQRGHHPLRLWSVIAKVRPKPEHPCYHQWQHGFLVIVVVRSKNPDSATAVAKPIIEQLPYELAAATVAVRGAEQLGDLCANAVAGGRQLGLGLSLLAFATGSDEMEFEASDFY
jgi:hypothetical protein